MNASSLHEQAAQLYQAGQAEEATRLCRQILDGAPDDFAANQLLGVIHFQQGHHDEALGYFDRAAARQPGFAILSNRGAALHLMGRFEDALASYDQAFKFQPRNAVLLYNRGRTLQDLGRFEEALASYQASLALDPNYAFALNNAANTMRALKRYPEALAFFDRALALQPGYAEAYYNRGNLQWSVNNNYHAALRDLEQALALDPAYDYAPGELLYLRMHGGDWRDFEQQRARINDGVRAGRRVVQPFHYQALCNSPADMQACAEIFTRHHFPPAPPVARETNPGKKIRLGYVAGEFREHATSWLMAGLFGESRPGQIRVDCLRQWLG